MQGTSYSAVTRLPFIEKAATVEMGAIFGRPALSLRYVGHCKLHVIPEVERTRAS